MRRMQRTRLSVSPRRARRAAVPSGELSSTKMTSQSQDGEKTREPLDQDRDVGALVESRHDDAEFGRRANGRDRSARAGVAGEVRRNIVYRRLRQRDATFSSNALLLYPRARY